MRCEISTFPAAMAAGGRITVPSGDHPDRRNNPAV
jgi:hypothetical protein